MAEESGEKRVSWVELYFDLVLVFAVTQVAARLHSEPTGLGLLRAFVIFVPIYWSWVGTSILGNTRALDTPRERLSVFAVGLSALLMALAVPHALDSRGLLFAIGYLMIRLVLISAVGPGGARRPGPYTLALYVSAPLLLLGSAWHGDVRLGLWAAAGATDLSGPTVFRTRLRQMQIEPSHLPERYGLFVIIALGESVVGIGSRAAAHADLSASVLAATTSAFVLTTAMWWTYFAFGSDAIHFAIRTAESRTDMIRFVLTYAHVSFISAIIAVAVGLNAAVEEPAHDLRLGYGLLLYLGAAVYLATFGATRYRMFKQHSSTRLTAAAVAALLTPLALHLPAWTAVLLLALLVTAPNVVEHRRVRSAESL